MYLSDLKVNTPVSICISTSKSKHTFECVVSDKVETDSLLSLTVTDSTSLLNTVLEDFRQCDIMLQDDSGAQPLCIFTDVTLGITSTSDNCVTLAVYDDAIGEFTDRRAWPRYAIDWTGVLVTSNGNVSAKFQLHDVSKYGLGLDIQADIPTNDVCNITVKNQASDEILRFKAQVLHKNLVSPGLYHCGLSVVDDDFDLMSIIRVIEGCD